MEKARRRRQDEPDLSCDTLLRKKHIKKLIEALTSELPERFEMLVPAQTWTVYWITHSLALLEQPNFIESVSADVIEFIRECAHPRGGYGGGPGQIAHLATSFAAVNALITLATEEALESIDRVNLVRFLHRMKQANGSFCMHDDGEIDSRATYCALAISRCLNIQDAILLHQAADWVLSCQTYEGGFGSVPGSEAHGGYTFCCVASLCLLEQLHRADLPALLRWLVNKQLSLEGGFCGRSNKLVDSCYSYWQGAVFPLIHPYLRKLLSFSAASDRSTSSGPSSSSTITPRVSRPTTRSASRAYEATSPERPERRADDGLDMLLEGWIFECARLQDYVLNQCQSRQGLLRDKPGEEPDFYHTCYALSGLSISQHQPTNDKEKLFDIGSQPINLLQQTHPLFNLTLERLDFCASYFRNKKIETFHE